MGEYVVVSTHFLWFIKPTEKINVNKLDVLINKLYYQTPQIHKTQKTLQPNSTQGLRNWECAFQCESSSVVAGLRQHTHCTRKNLSNSL